MKKGFTLLELLIVIAIIGILAAVVLASLSQARGRGQVAVVQSDANSFIKELYILNNGALPIETGGGRSGSPCPDSELQSGNATFYSGSAKLLSLMTDMKKNSYNGTNTYCFSTPTTGNWVIAVFYPTGNKAWCFDSSGVNKEIIGNTSDIYSTVIQNGPDQCY
jgi:prepilin-type N-terminal cleavage/methylation domain-containing protein